ncbi:3-carboxy-cis,cis-muconate cycloisomerase [Pararhizobium antarcticum]|uniref:3-carboxy-cis,cis-muconate cycloisomerase n=1 Tax=Pararhizobium antarcticum TaxID=1798805 RepID=A0A657LX85_9HYPH|nr:3-carboxy-cis,cis-muconate cycloisomerase [Pararhizobium antarcticum]OJF94102.1 3-carboxy-cis,cis-muconate cycloisomerase [Rhizobium sp. 58]OJF99588.1 3-carboxy-cis,cis-muconate cycloisomerase [Pararhizobium antarcticum]
MTYSAFDHPILSGLFGDPEIAALFSVDADITAMLAFEAALARVQAARSLIPDEAAAEITHLCASFSPDKAALGRAVASDGVVIPELVRQIRRSLGDNAAHLHVGATSQDVIDTSLMLRLKAACGLVLARLSSIIDAMAALESRDGAAALMGYTRMQAAIPITAADRIRSWRAPLERHRLRMSEIQATLAIQFGGAAGTLEKFGTAGPALRSALAAELGLADQPQWHSQRDGLVEIAGLFSLITGSLGKFGQDIALMAESGGEITLSGGGGSSAMPHKQNPVAAEVLVSLARFNAVQLSGMHQSLVHEQERSGAAWTLEWLILPQMAGALAASLKLALSLTGQITRIGRTAA